MFVYVHETFVYNKKYQVWMIAILVSSMSVYYLAFPSLVTFIHVICGLTNVENSLDPCQNRHDTGPDQDPSRFYYNNVPERMFDGVNFQKQNKNSRQTETNA